jgi:hypothetical protein
MRAAAEKLRQEAREQSYKNDPVAWAEEELGLVLWSKQKEILRSIAQNKRTAVKSCHSIGKTFISAIASAWWVSTRDNCIVQATAPTYQQIHALLFEEIRKVHLTHNLRGRVTLGDKWMAPVTEDGRTTDVLIGEGRKPANENIHGFHGTHRPDGVFVIADEGCGIPTTIFTGAEAITTASFDRILTVGNPDDPNTEFGRIFREGGKLWNLITVSAFDTPNFTNEAAELRAKYADNPEKLKQVERLLAGMPQHQTVADQKEMWGEDSPRYQSKVLAQFPKTSVDSLFTAAEIEIGRANVIEPGATAFKVLGVDVARYGSDRTVCVLNVDGHVEVLASYNTMDTMEVAARVHKLAVEHDIDQVRVDGIGVGGGVVDRLTALAHTAPTPYVVVEMTAGAKSPDRTLHRNSRAYWYDSLKHQLRNGMIDLPVGDNSSDAGILVQEMTGIRYSYPNGVMQIESKEDIRRRGDKSPDFVDALVMACAPIGYITEDPLATFRPGDMLEINVLDDIEIVSPF